MCTAPHVSRRLYNITSMVVVLTFGSHKVRWLDALYVNWSTPILNIQTIPRT
jgi:hypothetical protein